MDGVNGVLRWSSQLVTPSTRSFLLSGTRRRRKATFNSYFHGYRFRTLNHLFVLIVEILILLYSMQ